MLSISTGAGFLPPTVSPHFPRTFSGFAFQDAFRHSGIYLVLRFRFSTPQVICYKLHLKGVVLQTKNDVPRDLQYSKANLSCASATGYFGPDGQASAPLVSNHGTSSRQPSTWIRFRIPLKRLYACPEPKVLTKKSAIFCRGEQAHVWEAFSRAKTHLTHVRPSLPRVRKTSAPKCFENASEKIRGVSM